MLTFREKAEDERDKSVERVRGGNERERRSSKERER